MKTLDSGAIFMVSWNPLPPSTGPLEGLECSKRAKNLINRKITIFYIEAIPPKNSNVEKKNCRSIEKKFQNPSKNFFGEKKFGEKKLAQNQSGRIWQKVDNFFSESDFFEKHVFESEQKKKFGAEKKFGV